MIDFSTLPAPAIVEVLDFETLLAERKARLIAAAPADLREGIAAALQLESEPLTIELQQQAYTELLLRQRINETAKASLLAYAEKEDLDNRAADYGVSRMLISPADTTTSPPTPAVWEEDSRLRNRCLLALEGMNTAGSRGAYLFHTMTAAADVLHAQVVCPEGGLVRVYIMDRRGNGIPDAALLEKVRSYLSAENRVPLCDTVETVTAQPKVFSITGTISFEDGASAATGGLTAARQRLDALLAAKRKLGTATEPAQVPLSMIYAALQVTGVASVTLNEPVADIVCAPGEFPSCQSISLT